MTQNVNGVLRTPQQGYYTNPLNQVNIDHAKLNDATNSMFQEVNGMFGMPLVQYEMPTHSGAWMNSIMSTMSTMPTINTTPLTTSNPFNFDVTPDMVKNFVVTPPASFTGTGQIQTGYTDVAGTDKSKKYADDEHKKIVAELAKTYGVPSTGNKATDEAVLNELKSNRSENSRNASKLASSLNKATNRMGTDDEALKESLEAVNKNNVVDLMDCWDKEYKNNTRGKKSLVKMIAADTSGKDREDSVRKLADALYDKLISYNDDESIKAADAFTKKVDALFSKSTSIFKVWSKNHINRGDQLSGLDEAFEAAREAVKAAEIRKINKAQNENEEAFAPKELTETEKRQEEIRNRQQNLFFKRQNLELDKQEKELDEQEKALGIA